jgi:hypothetical protein
MEKFKRLEGKVRGLGKEWPLGSGFGKTENEVLVTSGVLSTLLPSAHEHYTKLVFLIAFSTSIYRKKANKPHLLMSMYSC